MGTYRVTGIDRHEDVGDAQAVGDALAEVVMAEIAERGLLGRAAQSAFLAEYERRASHLRSAEIPVTAAPLTEWQRKRLAENEAGQAAADRLEAEGKFTPGRAGREAYLAELGGEAA